MDVADKPFWTIPQAGSLELSVIIVSYNTSETTIAAIRSVFDTSEGIDLEVIVHDNASPDGSAAAIRAAFGSGDYPNFRIVEGKDNIGFARGNNRAADYARGRYVLLLNPDTIVLPGALQELLAFARATPEAGIWAGQTLTKDGKIDMHSAWAFTSMRFLVLEAFGLRRVFPDRVVRREQYPDWDRKSVRQVDVVIGAYMLIDSRLWQLLKGLNEDMFMYYEEEEFCLRARKHGARAMFTPDSAIIHLGQASTDMTNPVRQIRTLAGLNLVVREHWSLPASLAARTLGVISVNRSRLKCAVMGWLTGDQSWQNQRKVWEAIWRRRDEWLNGYRAARE